MKLIAYILYVVTVLLISGFARANAETLRSLVKTQVQSQTSPLPTSECILQAPAFFELMAIEAAAA